jgi:hypothetical protein
MFFCIFKYFTKKGNKGIILCFKEKKAYSTSVSSEEHHSALKLFVSYWNYLG